jgi:thiamine-phosphate pyrophosphorylase
MITLTLVTDRTRAGAPLQALLREAARAGLDRVQVREKDLPGRALLELVRALLAAVAGTGTEVFVNARPDVASAAGAHGVQLPERGLPVRDVRRSFPRLRVGASRHSVEGALSAAEQGAHFVVLGPIFATPGKAGRALGLEALREASARVAVPIHAVGGIEPENARAATSAGAEGLLAIRPFLAEPAAALAAFRASLA